MARAKQAQPAHAHRAGGGAVAVEIADHDDARIPGDGPGQQRDRALQAEQPVRRGQCRQARPRLLRRQRAAHRVQAPQQRRHGIGPVAARHGFAPADAGQHMPVHDQFGALHLVEGIDQPVGAPVPQHRQLAAVEVQADRLALMG